MDSLTPPPLLRRQFGDATFVYTKIILLDLRSPMKRLDASVRRPLKRRALSIPLLSRSLLTTLLATAWALTQPSYAAETSTDLADLGIEQLMSMEVTTASKKQQKLSETASAVFVLTSDDIRRSGATTLPELLLMVPGVHGGAVNSHVAAIGIRGLGGQWTNNLLVLIDGRSIFTRTFSGVYWDSYNIVFEDIERIEVIRGANAALWGANAVNGVINIITKSSSATQGTLLRATAGTEANSDIAARQGIKLGESGFGRVYVNGEKHGDSALSGGGNANDKWNASRAGFRTDWDLRSGDRLTFQGDVSKSDTHSSSLSPEQLASSGTIPVNLGLSSSAASHGSSLLANWTHAYAVASEWSVQIDWSHSDRDEFIPIVEDTVNFNFQHRFQPLAQHDLVWGFSALYRRDQSHPTPLIQFDPADASDTHASLFFQDEIALADNQYHLIIGSRFEHDPFNGWEVQPNLRALWNISEAQELWAAVSRSARTPSRVDRDIATLIPLQLDIPPYGVVPTTIALRGNPDFKTETTLSYELGYRIRSTDNTSFDLALFNNHYHDLRSVTQGDIVVGTAGLTVYLPMANTMEAETWGGELCANWVPSNDLRLQAFWSELRVEIQDPMSVLNSSYGYNGAFPKRQIGLRADWDFAPRLSADLQLKYVDELPAPFNQPLITGGKIPAYVDVDLRLAWQVLPELELALLGKNLFERSRLEFSSESGAVLTEVQQAAYLRATWSF